MTEDAATIPVHQLPANRLEALGHRSPRRKPEGGPTELTARHKLLISYMVNGCPHAAACRRIVVKRTISTAEGLATIEREPEPNEPLSLIEAADLLNIKRRNARDLASFPIFKRELERQLQCYRDGERIASVRTLVEVRDDPGLGRAADRKVRLQASMALLGEAGNTGPTVNVNVGQPLVAGIVIERYQAPSEEELPTTIEHEAKR